MVKYMHCISDFYAKNLALSIAVPHVAITVARTTFWAGHKIWTIAVVSATLVVIAETTIAVCEICWRLSSGVSFFRPLLLVLCLLTPCLLAIYLLALRFCRLVPASTIVCDGIG